MAKTQKVSLMVKCKANGEGRTCRFRCSKWTHHRDGLHDQAVIALWRKSAWRYGPEPRRQLSRFRRVLVVGRREISGGLVLRHLLVGAGGPAAGENLNASIGGYSVLCSANY